MKYIDSIKRASCFLLILFTFRDFLYSQEDSERFILPETVPSIEKLNIPHLDQPLLRKQKFVSESVITPSQVWQEPRFSSFLFDQYLIDIELLKGNFNTLGGHIICSSPKDWELSVKTYHSDGEREKLSTNEDAFSFQIEKFLNKKIQTWGKFNVNEHILWDQYRNNHSIESGLIYYIRNNLNMKTQIIFDRTEFRDIKTNESWLYNLALKWQPELGHDISVEYSYENDTGFSNYDYFSVFDLKYNFMVRTGVILGSGCRLYEDILLPQANLIWYFLSRLRLDITYKQDIEKPVWSKLYSNDRYLAIYPDLIWPDTKFSLGEKLSYYWGENGLVELLFFQKNVKNMIYWETVRGTDYITPNNIDSIYMSGCKASFNYSGETLSPKFVITNNFNSNIPFESAIDIETMLDYYWYSWTIGLGYCYVSERYYSLDDDKLDGYSSLFLSLKKYISSELELFIKADNLLKDRIETQPGFYRSSTEFQSGIALYF